MPKENEDKPDKKAKKSAKLPQSKKNEGEDDDGAEYDDMKKKTGTLAKEHLRKLKAKSKKASEKEEVEEGE